MLNVIASHADYPHFPGSLFDCAACEAECFCCPSQTTCVRCEIASESGTLSSKQIKYIDRFTY